MNPFRTFAAVTLCLLALLCVGVAAAPFGGPTGTLSVSGNVDTNGGSVHVTVHDLTFANWPYYTIVGLSAINVGFGNYVMVPAPDLIYARTCDGDGADHYSAPFPVGLPAGTHLYMQCWQNTSVETPLDPPHWEGTNAIEIVVQP